MLKKILRFFTSGISSIESILHYPNGKRIYRDFHPLRRDNMDAEALKVINRLNRHGYRSYLVGGCVRDMLLGKRPKDYDVVTTATPNQIRKIFSNSRIIGRRFKIVHVIFFGKVIEVSTFRSLPKHRLTGASGEEDLLMKRDNEFGTPREDAARRDFTINALYFDVRNESLIDYVNGFDHINEKKISVIGDANISFREDPVRMLRAAKFAALLNFQMDSDCLKAIRKNKHEIEKASSSRMLEEYGKIFRTGRSSEIFTSLADTGLLHRLFQESMSATEVEFPKAQNFLETGIGSRLAVADKLLSEREDLTTPIFYALIFADQVRDLFEPEPKKNILAYIKSNLDPVFKRLNLPGRDRDRLIQIFVSQPRFLQKSSQNRKNAEVFRNKIFFYEAFMLFKIQSIATQNEESIQKAMFWEIGPRPHPPDPAKIVSLFKSRTRHPARDRDRDRESKFGRGRRGGEGRSSRSKEPEALVEELVDEE
jgi:poly(A) polymerase